MEEFNERFEERLNKVAKAIDEMLNEFPEITMFASFFMEFKEEDSEKHVLIPVGLISKIYSKEELEGMMEYAKSEITIEDDLDIPDSHMDAIYDLINKDISDN